VQSWTDASPRGAAAVRRHDGAPTAAVKGTGCGNASLDRGETCTITLTFDPNGAPDPVSGTLVIHQNLKGPATQVPVSAVGGTGTGPSTFNLALEPGVATCTLSATGQLTVTLPLHNTGVTAASPGRSPSWRRRTTGLQPRSKRTPPRRR
jgi:hypothetical protein